MTLSSASPLGQVYLVRFTVRALEYEECRVSPELNVNGRGGDIRDVT
jgi:hypothetical protein